MVGLIRVIFPLLALVSSSIASPVKPRSVYAVKDTHPVPRRWRKIATPHPDHTIHLQIGMKQSKFDELERHLYEVSDPDHERYGQHLSVDEVNQLVKPTDETLQLVQEWLYDNGIKAHQLGYNPAGDWISVALPVSQVESLLETKYSTFEHEDGAQIVRAPEWSLPIHLHEHIETIQPTNSFFRAAPRKSNLKISGKWKGPGNIPHLPWTPPPLPKNPTVAEVCNTSLVTPLCLRTLYGTYDYKPLVPGKNRVGLNDFLDESNNRSDTKLFLQTYRPEAASAADSFNVVVINGGNNEQTQETPEELAEGKDLEGNLDSETILGISYPTPLTAFTTGGMPPFIPEAGATTDTNEPYLVWVQYALSYSPIPQVISTSYGDDEQTVPLSYATQVCKAFAQLGARGVSLLFASGDGGVGGDASGCVSNDGKNRTEFLPSFPDGCPYVTSVGATHEFNPEVVAFDPDNGFSSGGGFSNYFPRPAYQDAAVKGYLAKIGNEFKGLYNASGRAYPDIAAQGQSYATIWNGTLVPLDGTSASTPCASAVLTLVNDALLAVGKSPLGFLNPWLYKYGYPAFTDITSGSAIGCGTSGFPAVQGWDAVTGFGTPFFPKVVANALLTSSLPT